MPVDSEHTPIESQNKERPRVVVAGVGAVTAQGPTADALWQGVKAGRGAIRAVQKLSMDGLRTTLGGEVEQDPIPEHTYPRPDDFRERALDFALTASEEAMTAAGVDFGDVPADRWGVVLGTCNAGLLSGERWFLDRREGREGDARLTVLSTPQGLAEAIGGAFGVKGPVLSIDTACAAGANAIGYAAELVRSGQADAVLTGGTDAFSDVLFAGFNSLESLSPKPAAPYSKDREGLSLGEGSGMLVLIREDVAREQGLPILAEVLGYGLSADGYHPTAPHPEGEGAARAIRAGLKAAGVSSDEVRYVNSHGTGTAKNDPAETNATKAGLGAAAAQRVAVSSTKSMIGHLLGAAGAVEGIVTVKALEEQIAPPTANYTEADPECDLDYVPNEARPLEMDIAVSNNFAFGGANASVVLARAGARDSAPPVPAVDRVVVTGMSALTPAGIDIAAVWEAYQSGQTAVRDEDGVGIGRVELDATPWLSKKESRRMDRLGIFAVVASQIAINDAGIEITDDNRGRVGCIFATGLGPMETMERFAGPLFDEGPAAANPAVFPNTVYNAAGGQVAMRLGTVGPASTVTAGHAAGASALCYGYDLAAADQSDVVVCTAADTLTDTVVAAYRQLGALGDEGFALSEAGIGVVVERLSAAKARGARIYGEILGHGIASDGLGVGRWDQEGDGLERAMHAALDAAGLKAADVATVWANNVGSDRVDAGERAALDRVFGGNGSPNIISTNSVFGEPMGAGGALHAVMAMTAWQHDRPSGPVMVNSSSLGGTHFSIVIAPPDGQ